MRLYKQLCGENGFRKVILVTSHSGLVTTAQAEKNKIVLASKWEVMLGRISRIERCTDKASALSIIMSLANDTANAFTSRKLIDESSENTRIMAELEDARFKLYPKLSKREGHYVLEKASGKAKKTWTDPTVGNITMCH